MVLDLRLPEGRGIELRPRHPQGRAEPRRSSSSAARSRTPTRSRNWRPSGWPATSTSTPARSTSFRRWPRTSSPTSTTGGRVRASVLGVPVTYRVGNTIATALSLNISHGGLGVRTTSPLEIGASVKVRFRLPKAASTRSTPTRVVAWADRTRRDGAAVHTIDPDRSDRRRRVTCRRTSSRIARP